MGITREDDSKGVGKCNECGQIFTVGISKEKEPYILGAPECQNCGCEEFTVIEAEDLGMEE